MNYNCLTQLAARSAVAGRHSDGQGLWLMKSNKERGKWVLRYFVAGRRREMGLGRWPDVSIAEAREKASEARRLTRSQLDPIDERRKAKRVVRRLTVKEAIDRCFEARKAELKGEGKSGRWMSPLSVHVIPKIGNHAIEDVDQRALKNLLEPLWHTKPEVATKALNRLNLTLRHAAALGLSVDLQACMKTRALLGKQRHVTEHIPPLAYSDTPAFLAPPHGRGICTGAALSDPHLRTNDRSPVGEIR